jgi:hypothetical protein
MKKTFTYYITFLLLSIFPASIFSQSGNWKNYTDKSWYNDESSIFFIKYPAQLAGLAELVNSGKTFEGKKIVLESIIDLKAHYWTPIGNDSRIFKGIFDGNFYPIRGLYITSSS